MIEQQKLKIAALQMVSTPKIEENLDCAALLIRKAKKAGAQMVLLPEYFTIMANKETDKLLLVEEHNNGRVQSLLSSLAKELGVWIVGGTHPISSADPNKPYARCYVYNADGACVCWYDKVHLFDVEVDDRHKSYQESRFSTAGNHVISFESPWGKIGLAVCYDLRFPELFRQQAEQGAKLLLLPAAFTKVTGKAHWDILLKARAIENLCFVVASAQAGLHENGRETWGHSCIISPWGETLDSLKFEPGYVLAELDFKAQKNLRAEFPVLNHRRL
jgi:deaminated glutathione amidase